MVQSILSAFFSLFKPLFFSSNMNRLRTSKRLWPTVLRASLSCRSLPRRFASSRAPSLLWAFKEALQAALKGTFKEVQKEA